jgi:hypothetical protein
MRLSQNSSVLKHSPIFLTPIVRFSSDWLRKRLLVSLIRHPWFVTSARYYRDRVLRQYPSVLS